MLKTVLDEKNAAKKRAVRHNPSVNLSLDLSGPDVQRNPFKFIESAIKEAKYKINSMETSDKINDITSNHEKKKILKADNKYLQESLKKMSENVNFLIEKMNYESLKTKPKKMLDQNQSHLYDDAQSVAKSQIVKLKPSNTKRGVSGISKISAGRGSQLSSQSPDNSNNHR